MKMKMFGLCMIGVAACGGEEDPLAACAERDPQIERGVYGCTTSTDDVGDNPTEVNPGFDVQIFTAQPPATPDDGLTPFAHQKSDKTGYYEISLAPGSYWICTTFRRCGAVTVADAPVRKDYDFGEGPGW